MKQKSKKGNKEIHTDRLRAAKKTGFDAGTGREAGARLKVCTGNLQAAGLRGDGAGAASAAGYEVGRSGRMRKNLKEARQRAGLTQQQLADKLGIGLRYYKQIEAGQRTGDFTIWDMLEDITGIHQRKLREISSIHPGKVKDR